MTTPRLPSACAVIGIALGAIVAVGLTYRLGYADGRDDTAEARRCAPGHHAYNTPTGTECVPVRACPRGPR